MNWKQSEKKERKFRLNDEKLSFQNLNFQNFRT